MGIFDKSGSSTLKYTEFCDAFLPLDNDNAAFLAGKPPVHQGENINWETALPQ